MPNQCEKENHSIKSLCYIAARNLYGDSVPEMVALRMEDELQHIQRNRFAAPYLFAARIVEKARADEYLTAIRGSVGSSFVAYLLGMTEINPLPPHYRCHNCKRIEWVPDKVGSGFDLPNKFCPKCGSDYRGDGHKIPYAMFLGVHGDIPPNIDLYVAREYEDRAMNELKIQMENHELNSTYPMPDIVSHDGLSIMKRLHSLTNVCPRVIPMNDPKVLSLFRSTAELNVTPEQVKTEVATYGIPEMGIGWVREMLEITQPSSFSQLVQISGLSHGTGAWEGNARERIQVGVGSLATSIAFRDQLMMELIDYGMEMHKAYGIAQSVRKGKISVSCSEAMLKCNVPDWYIESCQKIKYLFPKSQAVSYVISAVRYAFYKLYYPLEFYAAYFTVRGNSLDMELCAQGSEAIKKSLEEAQHEVDHSLLGLALEMTVRGIRFKKTNHTGHEYVITDGKNSLEVPLK